MAANISRWFLLGYKNRHWRRFAASFTDPDTRRMKFRRAEPETTHIGLTISAGALMARNLVGIFPMLPGSGDAHKVDPVWADKHASGAANTPGGNNLSRGQHHTDQRGDRPRPRSEE